MLTLQLLQLFRNIFDLWCSELNDSRYYCVDGSTWQLQIRDYGTLRGCGQAKKRMTSETFFFRGLRRIVVTSIADGEMRRHWLTLANVKD